MSFGSESILCNPKQTSIYFYEKDYLKNLQIQKFELKVEKIMYHLNLCGKINAIHKFYCQECHDLGKEALLHEHTEKKISCGIKFCKNPDCLNLRYAKTSRRLYETQFLFLNKKGKEVYRNITEKDEVMHCSISPEPVETKDIKQTKKKLLQVMHKIISKLNKGSLCPLGFRSYLKEIKSTYIDGQGIEHNSSYKLRFYKKGTKEIICFKPLNLRGIRVFDIKHYWKDGKNLPHYHLAFLKNYDNDYIPIALIQYLRKEMMARAKKKFSFHIQFHLGEKENHGYKPAKAVLTYMSKRAIGVFGKSDKYTKEQLMTRKIRDIFKDRGTYSYQDFMSIGEYAKYFHNQKTISYFGSNIKRLYIHNDMPFLKDVWPLICTFHGELSLEQIHYERSEELIKPPPDPQLILSKFVKDEQIENIRSRLSVLELARKQRKTYPGKKAEYPMKPLPDAEDIEGLYECTKRTKLTNQERILRVIDPKGIKLKPSDYIELAITGKC